MTSLTTTGTTLGEVSGKNIFPLSTPPSTNESKSFPYIIGIKKTSTVALKKVYTQFPHP